MKKFLVFFVLSLICTISAICLIACEKNDITTDNDNVQKEQSVDENKNDVDIPEPDTPEKTIIPLYKRVNENNEENADGEYIYFGTYPQSEVIDETLKSDLTSAHASILPSPEDNNGWTSYKYYINGENTTDYMWFKDIDTDDNGTNDFRAVYFIDYRPNYTTANSSANKSNQDDNGYNINNIYWFRYEPIKWRILSENNGNAILLAELILDSQQYDDYSNNYASSTIRTWLNETFYNTAFNTAQQEKIITTTVDNSVKSTNPDNNSTKWNEGVNDYFCEDTEDKIYLLSEQEITTAEYGFSTDPSNSDIIRRKKTSDYAQSQGIYTYKGGNYDGNGMSWWLRSPYPYERNSSWLVYFSGTSGYYYVYYSYFGVVPALQISL